MIHLHPHSQRAYNSILELLPVSHKAAVIHPTGTGKSFIAFRLTEQYAEKRFVWLSPSETIFKTQCQNVNRTYGYKAENVIFATYAKLSYLSDAEIEKWKPDYIILDEFHRCGAKEWGFGVQRVLKMHPDAMLVGLSATNIRYLDNQRDMAMELFDGCIADQITLPEAIARGILPAPKYVISIYSYEKELHMIENALTSTWDAMYREAEKYYQEHGDLLVPKKYYTQDSNLPLGLWIITQRRVYRGAVNGTLTPERIAKLDRIGMVWEEKAERLWEEGYQHAEAYYREHGNLDVIAAYVCEDGYRLGTWISNQRGKKKGRAGRALTDEQIKRLEKIGMIWSQVDYAFEQGYLAAKEYLEEHGDLWVPASYVSPDGFRLGNWLLSKRTAYANRNETQLTDEQQRRLEALGFVWDNRHEVSWEEHYQEAAAYAIAHGNLAVRFDYRQNGKCIYRWLSNQRDRLAQGKLPDDKQKRLEALNPAWQEWLDSHPITEQNRDYMSFEYGYPYALAYHRANGNLRVPRDYVTEDGYLLGKWTKAMRAAKVGTHKKPLTAKQIQYLEELGMLWNKNDELWENNYDVMRQYVAEHGDMNMPQNYQKPLGTRIQLWLSRTFSLLKEGKLPEDKLKKLETLEPAWTEWLQAHSTPAPKKASLTYDAGLLYAKDFQAQHGHLRVPKDYTMPDGYPLGSWIMAMRDAKENRHHRFLTDAQIAELESLGMYWSRLDEIWDENFLLVRQYYEQHGNIDVPKRYENGAKIRQWLRANRDQVVAGTIKKSRLEKLKSFGDAWIQWIAQ